MINNNTKPNYENYRVNRYEEHSLYEDWMNKRPFGFQFNGSEVIEVKVWYEMLRETCLMLYEIDPDKFRNFENLPHMNGNKRKHFSTNPNDLRKALPIIDGIYVERNRDSNSMRRAIINMLKEYGFDPTDYIVYYSADYTELHN